MKNGSERKRNPFTAIFSAQAALDLLICLGYNKND